MHLGKSNGKNRTKIDKKILKATRNIDNEPFCYYDHFKRGFLMDVSQWSCVVKWLSHCQLTTTSTTTTHNAKGIWKRQEISIDNELFCSYDHFKRGFLMDVFRWSLVVKWLSRCRPTTTTHNAKGSCQLATISLSNRSCRFHYWRKICMKIGT